MFPTPTASNSGSGGGNGPMYPPPAGNPQSPGLKTYFKAPEGRCNLHLETHPSGFFPLPHAKSDTQITVAQLKERPAQVVLAPSSSYSSRGGVRHVAAKLLGSGNGSRGISSVGRNGMGKANGGASGSGFLGGFNRSNSMLNSNFDGKGTFFLFNAGDTLYVCDLNSQNKEPIKAMYFSYSNPVCHTFNSEAKDGHDLLIGLTSGDVYSVSLRQQLQDVGKKLVGTQHYNKAGSTNNSRCTSVAWIPGHDGMFVVAHADGNLYTYEKSKDGTGDASFPFIRDHTQFSVAHAKSSKANPIARWHICQGSINAIAFSADGKYLATAGRDGYLRVFDYSNEQLICGGKIYYGAVLCCAWSGDGKYILTGGEDDLVQVWSMEDRKIVAWGKGHNSWVSRVAFDSYWSPPTLEDTEENVIYRFGSVGQDTRLLLWDLSMDEIAVPFRRCHPGGSPAFSTGSQSSHRDSATVPVGTLQPSPRTRDVPKLSPLVAQRIHSEPLSGLIFTQESILTASWDGHVKIWMRPTHSEQLSNSKALLGSGLEEETSSFSKFGQLQLK